MEEVADEDSHRPRGLKISDPILIGPEEAADNARASDTEDEVFLEIVQEFTRERFPEGPKFNTPGVDPSLPSILPQEQMDDLNDILFAMCEDFVGKAKAKGPLTDKDIPRLREEWKNACQDILGGAPNHLPLLREINHHIPLVDEKKRYNYHLPKCPDSMRKPLAEKISKYCKARWW
jgi:hypothetical protein